MGYKIRKSAKWLALISSITIGCSSFAGLFGSSAKVLADESLSVQPADHVLISRFYVSGNQPSCDGSTIKNTSLYSTDFIELYNPTTKAVDLNGYSLQYLVPDDTDNNPASTPKWDPTITPLSGQIAAHGYYLVREGALAAAECTVDKNGAEHDPVGADTLAPDADSAGSQFDMDHNSGTIALVSNRTPLRNAANGTIASDPDYNAIVDLVGYGVTPLYLGSGSVGGNSDDDVKPYTYFVRKPLDPANPFNPDGIDSQNSKGGKVDFSDYKDSYLSDGNGLNTDDNENDFMIVGSKTSIPPTEHLANEHNTTSPVLPDTVYAAADPNANQILMKNATQVNDSVNKVYVDLPVSAVKTVLSVPDDVYVDFPPELDGLTATAAGQPSQNRIAITIGGEAKNPITSDDSFQIMVKSGAVTSGETKDSVPVTFTLRAAGANGTLPIAAESTGASQVWMESATAIDPAADSFAVKLDLGTVKSGALDPVTYTVYGLPAGLGVSAAGDPDENTVTFTVYGTAAAAVTAESNFSIVLHSGAVEGSGLTDSAPITGFTLEPVDAAIKSMEQTAWNSRMFQLYDHISIGKAVADFSGVHAGDDLNLGGFSGLVHVPGDPINVFYTITDRGPNGDADNGILFPIPTFSPRIMKIELANGEVKVLQQIPLKLPSGFVDPITGTSEISGVPNFPSSDTVQTVVYGQADEVPIGADGQQLPSDPYGLDIESIGYNSTDDTFWIGEEYRPSAVEVKRDGTILQRLVPQGEESLFDQATAVPVHGILPAVFSARELNKGFEGGTVSPDGKYLFLAVQAPLVNSPSDSTAIRVLKLDLSTKVPTVAGEYLYVLDGGYLISDMSALDDAHVLFDERDSGLGFKRIYKADFSNATNLYGKLDNTDGETLESVVTNGYSDGKSYTVTPPSGAAVTVVPVQKSLFFDAKKASIPYPNPKLEGIAMPNDHTLVAANDNDFSSDPEQVWLYTLDNAQTETSATAASSIGTVSEATYATGNTSHVTIQAVLGEDAVLGTVAIRLPDGVMAATSDTVSFAGESARHLTSNQIALNGHYVMLDGVTLNRGQTIQLDLSGKTVSGSLASPLVYVDSDGPEAVKSLSASFAVSSSGRGTNTNRSGGAYTDSSGDGLTADANGQVNAESLKQALAASKDVKINIKGDSAILPASALIDAVKAGGSITVVSDAGTYTLPLSILDLNALAKDLDVDVANLFISITIHQLSDDEAKAVNQAASGTAVKLLADPVEFQVEAATGGGKSEPVRFGERYVSRSITMGSSPDPDQSTEVLYNETKHTLVFVPTVFGKNDAGTPTATIMRNGNSIYTVVQAAKTFDDIQNHWAKADIELLANKLIVSGESARQFEPNKPITRAEFAALAARALGLVDSNGTTGFKDVASTAWYAPTLSAAVKAGIIKGYADQTFRPNDAISREELASMMVLALHYAGVQTTLSSTQQSTALERFTDAGTLGWAKVEMAEAVSAGLVSGETGTTLSPSGQATRAEAVSMLKRMLVKANFIN